MRVFVVDTRSAGRALRCGLMAVVGAEPPSAGEKRECVDVVSRLALEGWAIAADPGTLIGRLAAVTARAAGAEFRALSPRSSWVGERVGSSPTQAGITGSRRRITTAIELSSRHPQE